MTAPRGPLPGLNLGDRPLTTTGHWRGQVAAADPLRVDVPELTGQGSNAAVEVVAGVDGLAAGDRVWVSCINGNPRWLLVTHRRR